MKSFEEFSQMYEKIKQNTSLSQEEIDAVIKKHYEKYENDHFNEWLHKFSVDYINKVGVKNLRELWESMDYCDR